MEGDLGWARVEDLDRSVEEDWVRGGRKPRYRHRRRVRGQT